jgi:hypothetical protein
MVRINLTEKELRLFFKAFKEVFGDGSINSDNLKSIYNSIESTMYSALCVPYEDLPLHINRYYVPRRNDSKWYRKCIELRLLIGR